MAYRLVDTPLGVILLATTPQGLVRVAYACQGHDRVLSQLAERVSPRLLHAPGQLDTAAREIEEYFAGQRRSFDLPLDRRLSHGFRRRVLDHVSCIGYGTTASYSAVAAAVGSPRAARAAGTACATNPLPILLPCHRIMRSAGHPGPYVGGTDAKTTLLTLEAGR